MSNKKQTSIEWLCKEYHLDLNSPIVIQAKMMHKEEVMEFTADWHTQWRDYGSNYDAKSIMAYYDEEFK